jgi:uncharacterized protein YkwD
VTWLDLLILAFLAYSAYAGFRRGAVLMGLELSSFLIATAVALFLYHPFGIAIKALTHTSAAIGNVGAFAIAWMVTEIVCALVARFYILPHLSHAVQLSRTNRIGGSLLGVLKSVVIAGLGVIVFAGLPFSAGTKHAVTDSYFGHASLAYSNGIQAWLATGLGHDLSDSLNFFTVTSDPEGTETIELGYKTTDVTIDQKEEDAMLVLLNHERTSRGLGPLTMNIPARQVARDHSKDMFARGYFSHITPEGKSPFDRLHDSNVDFGTAGENLALAPTLALAHQGLMNSPGHRANILDSHYRTVGIGIIDGGPYGLMITQDFTD